MTSSAANVSPYVMLDIHPGSQLDRETPQGISIDDIDVHVMYDEHADEPGAVGIRASAAIVRRAGHVLQFVGMIHTAGCWGIDDDAEYRAAIADEELAELQALAVEIGADIDHTHHQIERSRARCAQVARLGI